MSKTTPFMIPTPSGTKFIYMSVTSADHEFSSSKLSWMSGGQVSSLDFTRPTGSRDDVLVDNMYGLHIGVITKEIPPTIHAIFTVPTTGDGWDDMPGWVVGPITTRVGPRGSATMVQVKFQRPLSNDNVPRAWTTVTILYHPTSGGYA